ncbi:MAG: hypothetical protein DWQ04_33650 [Chloroflexi bacterium]|nr:MAG: hypothetical protein DWQ04_33650 [Chloroflexota bacterium]
MLENNYYTKYDQWNLALAKHFYNESQAGKPVYLQVDDEVLRCIAPELGIPQDDGRAAFVAAVRYRSRLNDDPFFRFFRYGYWERTELKADPTTPPPFIAFLGFCVLAAFDMASDENISRSNYYVRLQDLLGVKRPKKFDDVGELWERLNQWLDKDLEQKHGKATASYVNHRHVGYPISQALLRTADRQKLPDFFLSCDLEPDEDWVTPEQFKNELLLEVAKYTWPFTNRVKRVFDKKNKDAMTLIAQMVYAEYEGWDGRSTEEIRSGIQPIEPMTLHLELNYDDFECTLYPRAQSRNGRQFPEGTYQYQPPRSIKLEHDPTLLDWFAAMPDTPFLQHLFAEKIIQLHKGKQYRQQFTPAPIMLFREDQDGELGGHVHYSGRPILRETYHLLCHNRLRTQVADYLKQNGNYDEVLTSDNPIYANWVCFRDVQIARRDENVIEDLLPLVPKQTGLSLYRKGGLRLGRNKYLRGGEPHVEIVADHDHETTIYIDDASYTTFSTETLSLDLKEMGWDDGSHTISVGENGRFHTFHIIPSGTNQRPFSLLGHHIKHEDPHYQPQSLQLSSIPSPEKYEPHHLYITGAQIKGSTDDLSIPIVHPVRIPYGRPRCIILGRRVGDVLETRLPHGYPDWKVKQLGWSNGIYVTVRFKPQWIIRIKGNQKTLTAVTMPEPPIIPNNITGDKEKWVQWARKNLCRKRKQHKEIWDSYRQVAEDLR